MIVLEDLQLVIVTPPHVGSSHLHRALCSPQWGGLFAIGPAPDGISIDHHYTRVAEAWRGFRIALVVRNPRTRLMGLFRHHNWWQQTKGLPDMRWADFVNFVARDDAGAVSWMYRFTISRLIQNLQFDSLIRFESLAEDVSTFVGSDVKISPQYQYDDGTASPLWTRDLLDVAGQWLMKDCDRFGYH